MSTRAKIAIALGLILGLHLLTAITGHVGLRIAERDFETYDEMNAHAIRILEIDESISELQRNVAVYMNSGHASAADRVREIQQHVTARIMSEIADDPTSKSAHDLNEMAELIRSYGENFEKVAVDRARRLHLVDTVMADARSSALGTLTRNAEDGGLSPSDAADIEVLILRGESTALRYFETPRGGLVDEATTVLEQAAARAESLGEQEVNAAISRFRDAFLDATQSTRGFLHLVNVVLAGEAASLSHTSHAVRDASMAQRDRIKKNMEAASRRVLLISDVMAAVAVLFGIATSTFLVRVMIRPVLDMTATFQRLATGDSEARISGMDRNDEIGEMAAAAEVFRKQNIETQDLLRETQTLAADLERQNREMTDFVRTVSHDLKSPLVSIQGYAGVLRETPTSPEDTTHAIDRIGRAATRMMETLNDLLELSRISGTAPSSEPIDLGALCADVVGDFDMRIESDAIDVTMDAALGTINGDPTRVRQAIQNLVENAIKYGQPESGRATLAFSTDEAPHATILSVADNGPGIETRFQDQIFTIFQQLDAGGEGTGIGLAIVRKIAEAHGGCAWVESVVGNGTKFRIAFPRDPAWPIRCPAAAYGLTKAA